MEKGHEIKVLDHGFVRLIDWLGDDKRIVECARISYKSPSKGDEQDKKLIEYLWKNLHTSPFENIKITLNIKMPIFVMRQYVRHRMQSLNEVSARYTELPNEFYIPTSWRKQDTKNKQGSIDEGAWNPKVYTIYDPCACGMGGGGASIDYDATKAVEVFCENSYKLYQQLLDAGVAREMARMVLPVNIYTEIYTTWDLKNLLHFVRLRDDAHAQAEIQEYGKAIKVILRELFPWTMEAYEKYSWKLSE